jgi:hypothetical protein
MKQRAGVCMCGCLDTGSRRLTHTHACTRIRSGLLDTLHRCGPRAVGSQAFSSASGFNADIGAWNTARVTTLIYVRAVSAVICVWRFGRRVQREPRRLEHRARQSVDICKCLFGRRIQRGEVMRSVGLQMVMYTRRD